MQNPAMLQQMMSNPAVQPQQMMQNPAVMQSMIDADPNLRALCDANPQLRTMLSDPAMLQRAAGRPTFRPCCSSGLMPGGFGGAGLGMGGAGRNPWAAFGGEHRPPRARARARAGTGTGTTGSAGAFDMALFAAARDAGTVGTTSTTAAPAAAPAAPEDRWAPTQMEEMGFSDRTATVACPGNVNAAIERLLQ